MATELKESYLNTRILINNKQKSGVMAICNAIETEWCPFCHQRYSSEMESRCASCDRPVCPMCVVREDHHGMGFCPECRTEI
jgi:hypothetical protein